MGSLMKYFIIRITFLYFSRFLYFCSFTRVPFSFFKYSCFPLSLYDEINQNAYLLLQKWLCYHKVFLFSAYLVKTLVLNVLSLDLPISGKYMCICCWKIPPSWNLKIFVPIRLQGHLIFSDHSVGFEEAVRRLLHWTQTGIQILVLTLTSYMKFFF